MGKGSRSKEMRTADPLVGAGKNKQNGKKKDRTGLMVGIVCAVLAVLVAGILCANAVAGSGFFIRNTVSITTTDYKINNTMVSYYFNSIYQNYLSTYSSYLSYLNLDTSASLKSQQAYDGTTWFQFFLNTTEQKIRELVLMAEAAREQGLTLDADDDSQISQLFTTLKARAKSADMSYDAYLAQAFGKGVREGDVRACMEMELLAEKYYASYIDSLSYSDDNYNTYYDENKNSLLKCDYKYYKLSADVTEEMTDEEKTAAMADAKTVADSLVAASSPDEFDEILRAYLTAKEAAADTAADDTAAETADEAEDTEEDTVEKTVAATLITGSSYNDSTDFGKWAFDEARVAGDTDVITGDSYYSIYYMVKPSYRDETATRNIRRILVASSVYGTDEETKAKAEEILAEFNAGDKTADAFAELAKTYSYDSNTAEDGGLYENYVSGANADTNFDAWAYDAARTPGDVEIVSNEDYGYDILFYESEGIAAWKETARQALLQADYDAKLTALAEQFSYTKNDDNLAKLDA